MEEMRSPIHKHTGILLFRQFNQNGIGKGTAIAISPNIILTAAHNVYDVLTEEQHSGFRFFPGQSGTLEQYYNIIDLYFPSEYKRSPKISNDYALLKLSGNIKANDFLPLCSDTTDLNYSTTIGIFGYPG